MFDEHTLRSEIERVWGPAGAHMDVFDSIMKQRNEMQERCAKVCDELAAKHPFVSAAHSMSRRLARAIRELKP